jgi:hypothetical protein
MNHPIAIAFAVCAAVSSLARAVEPRPVLPIDSAETQQSGPLVAAVKDRPEQTVACWLQTSLQRVYPTSPAGDQRTLSLLTARNRHVSFQACLANRGPSALDVGCSVAGAAGCDVLVRRVGYVPQWHATIDTPTEELDGVALVPGLVPDPLYPQATARIGPRENQSFWVTITVPAEAQPGVRELAIRFELPNGTPQVELHATLDIRSLVVQPRHDFPVTHWWRPETIYEHYAIEPFGEAWWKLAEAYIRNLVAHGNNVLFVQQLFPRREFVRRPAQMVKITCPAPGRYEFDWSQVRRLVRLGRECGATHFEWSHLWIYWGVQHAMPVYTMKDGQAVPLWPPDTDGHGELYTNFLRQFLPSFHQFLQEENLLDCSYFHLSDEPATEHIPNYRRARQTLRELAPWMKVMDALSDVEYGRQALTDMPIPVVSTAQAYIDEKIPHWVYFCCAPRGPYLNRFMDTPLAKIRMSGWLFYRLRAQGFLHWGYNCWQKLEQDAMIDPFTEGAAGLWPDIPYGDPFVVYPGPDGPLDSIRWEVFAESLEDYAMLQTAGVDPDDALLEDIRTYADFPKTQAWIMEATARVLERQDR